MEQLTQCATATEPVFQSPRAAAAEARVPGAHALQQEQPLQRDTHALQLASGPRSLQLEKSLYSNKDPHGQKKKKKQTPTPVLLNNCFPFNF